VNSVPTLQQRVSENPKLRNLFGRAEKIPPVDLAHDFSHILRVAKQTAAIFVSEKKRKHGADATVAEVDACYVSALLHDCVPVAKNSPLRKESSRLASEKAAEWLQDLKWDADQIPVIAGAILDHSFSSGRVPSSLLGESLQDADRLEALGALGLFRTIATGVSMGAALFDSVDPWAKNRELDDRRFSIDHFYTKLLKLPGSFRTGAAREEAKRRAAFLEHFLSELKHEIDY
jgi:uncharacterized protein